VILPAFNPDSNTRVFPSLTPVDEFSRRNEAVSAPNLSASAGKQAFGGFAARVMHDHRPVLTALKGDMARY